MKKCIAVGPVHQSEKFNCFQVKWAIKFLWCLRFFTFFDILVFTVCYTSAYVFYESCHFFVWATTTPFHTVTTVHVQYSLGLQVLHIHNCNSFCLACFIYYSRRDSFWTTTVSSSSILYGILPEILSKGVVSR